MRIIALICMLFFCQLTGSEDKEITLDAINQMREEFRESDRYLAMQNALSRNTVKQIAMNWDRYAGISHYFSHTIPNELAVTDQMHSGRCWLFSTLNLVRVHLAAQYNLQEMELSQSYLFFWDKLEKANYFFESAIETAGEAYDSRLFAFLFDSNYLFSDGGQWHMAVNLINKYGLVPKSIFPDSEACLNSSQFNQVFKMKLREQGATLRNMIALGIDRESVLKAKSRMLVEVYRMLSLHLGTPPSKFDWEFIDNENNYQVYRDLTPIDFYQNYVKLDLNDYVTLVNSPRVSTPYYNTYCVNYSSNVIEGSPGLYLNVPIEDMKEFAIKSLKDKEPVWIGCDVGQSFHADLGVMDLKLYDLDILYDVTFNTTKEMRMNYRESQPTHAMLFTGVNLINNKPTKWRVENSWGQRLGDNGYFVMTDEWFDEYMFEIIIHKKYLRDDLIELLELPPIMLEPWDPLAAVAKK